MRIGNRRTSVKRGRRKEIGSVGHAVRPRRLPPTLPPRGPQWRRWLGANSAISRPVATACESKAATAPAWPRQVRSSHARAGAYDQPRTCLRGRTRISPATSRILLGTLAWKSASGEAHRRRRAGRRTRSWRGAPQRRRAGWSCFVDRAESADMRHDLEVCPLRRCLFVVGLITILKEGVCSSRCWSTRSQVPMRR